MSRIIQAVNAMISNADKISQVIYGYNDELFFMYAGKYKWSIIKGSKDIFYLHYYPGKQDLEDLAAIKSWEGFREIVSYNSQDLGTKEAHDSLSELYNLIQEKLFKIDKVIDDIIKDDFMF